MGKSKSHDVPSSVPMMVHELEPKRISSGSTPLPETPGAEGSSTWVTVVPSQTKKRLLRMVRPLQRGSVSPSAGYCSVPLLFSMRFTLPTPLKPEASQ